MDETRPLINQGPIEELLWYKRPKVLIIIAVVTSVSLALFLVVVVPTIIVTTSKGSNHKDRCSVVSSLGSCIDVAGCHWCFDGSDGSGHCALNNGATQSMPPSCNIQIEFMCNAYGYATGQNQDTCTSFTVPGTDSPCEWCHVFATCDDNGGCCWSAQENPCKTTV